MRQGDLVVRNSYSRDVLFRIEHIDARDAILKGVQYRLLADAPLDDLYRIEEAESFVDTRNSPGRVQETTRLLERHRQVQRERNRIDFIQKLQGHPTFFEVPGKVLHLDGDPAYLRKSMDLYGQLRVPAEGYYSVESGMAELLRRLLPQVKPDIVVVTGHDGLLKHIKNADPYHLSSYKNSLQFVNAVRVAREYERNRDSLTIIAGACQSHFEALLQVGANFASSPGRILIHALDPAYIAAKSAYTSVKETMDMLDVVQHTVSGLEGVGGLESRGTYRVGLPRLKKFENMNIV